MVSAGFNWTPSPKGASPAPSHLHTLSPNFSCSFGKLTLAFLYPSYVPLACLQLSFFPALNPLTQRQRRSTGGPWHVGQDDVQAERTQRPATSAATLVPSRRDTETSPGRVQIGAHLTQESTHSLNN